MDTGSVQVLQVKVTQEEIDYNHSSAGTDIREALKAITKGNTSTGRQTRSADGFRLPLINEIVAIELSGIPVAVVNAIRRAVKDEIRGRCLTFDHEGFDRNTSTDPFMEDNYIRTRIQMIRLRPQIPEALVKNLRFALDAVNNTDRTISIYSGDLVVTAGNLTEPIFNPTYEIAFLQPGRTLRITDIRIIEGFGYQDAAFMVGVRATSIPLDLEEVPREETHNSSGKAVEQSGFLESSLVSNPRRHMLTVCIPAVPPGGRASITVLIDTCSAIMERLRIIQKVLEATRSRAISGVAEGSTHRTANAYFLVTPDGSRMKGVLSIRNETNTIGNLIARSIYELMPDIGFTVHSCISHEKNMKLTVVHEVSESSEIESIITRAVDHSYGIIGQIQRGIKAAL